MEKYFQNFSIFTGVVRYRDLSYLLATKDNLVKRDIPHTRVYTIDQGKCGAFDLSWSAVSASICWLPEEKFIAISPLGRVYTIGGGAVLEEGPVKHDKISPKERGPLREIRGIAGGRAYAVGTCRQAYRRDSAGCWTCIDETARSRVKNITDTSFESVDGFDEKDIFTVGWEGEIWHYDGKRWDQIDSPTNLALYKTRCSNSGDVFACGQSGILLRRRGGTWEVIEHEETTDDLFGLDIIDDRVFVSSMTNIYELRENVLEMVSFVGDPPETCNHLSSRDGVMWSIGAKDVMEFDGAKWHRILKIR